MADIPYTDDEIRAATAHPTDDNKFPLDFDKFWTRLYSRKENAVRALKTYKEGEPAYKINRPSLVTAYLFETMLTFFDLLTK
jgi:hypothetical protein